MKKTMNKILIFFFLITTTISYSQIEIKTLVNRENFIVKYYQNEEYLDIIIESNYTPFIYTDINRNNKTDPYIDKLYSVINGNSLCVANQLENNATTTCNQSTSATLDVNLKNYHFVIPKKELRYTLSKPIYISFGAFDKNSTTKYLITNRKKSYIIQP